MSSTIVNTSAAAAPAPAADAAATAAADDAHTNTLVQYIVMRADLIKQHKWNTGGLISNGSHACVAVLFEHQSDSDVQAYVSPSAAVQMHKVVLSVKDDAELVATSDLLQQNKVLHRVWTEQPDNLRSCLALKPYPRKLIQPLLRHLKLFR